MRETLIWKSPEWPLTVTMGHGYSAMIKKVNVKTRDPLERPAARGDRYDWEVRACGDLRAKGSCDTSASALLTCELMFPLLKEVDAL